MTNDDTVIVKQNSTIEVTKYCLNCNTRLQGHYCHQCGQIDKPELRTFWQLIIDFLENTFNYDSRVYKTLATLFFYPGKLTNEYLKGKRACYVPPLRMYLIISFLFFFIIQANISDTDFNNTDLPDNVVIMDSNFTGIDFSEEGFMDNSSSINNNTNDDIQKESEKENYKPDTDTTTEITTEKNTQRVDTEKQQQEQSEAPPKQNAININFNWLDEESNRALSKKLNQSVARIKWQAKNDPSAILSTFINLTSKLMFILLPVFALQLKLSYLFSKRLYMEHLIQTLHTHCFIFIFFMIANLPETFAEFYSGHIEFGANLITGLMDMLGIVLVVYFFYYLYKTLRVVYQQSRRLTIFKFLINSFLYFTLLILMIPVGFVLHAI